MKIFAIESSTETASCAICEKDIVIASSSLTVGLTHSSTLMVMVEDMFKTSGVDLKDIGAVAVSIGPGSFTGLRIGVAAAKGVAFGLCVPCVGVDTLFALSYNLIDLNGVICPVLDARRDTVYTALFDVKNKKIDRKKEDSVKDKKKLRERLSLINDNIFLVGDAAKSCYEYLCDLKNIFLAGPILRVQSAASVAFCAQKMLEDGYNEKDIAPKYIKLSQAQMQKQNEKRSIK